MVAEVAGHKQPDSLDSPTSGNQIPPKALPPENAKSQSRNKPTVSKGNFRGSAGTELKKIFKKLGFEPADDT